MFGNVIERVERMPVGVVATTVGLVTLANVYFLLKFTYVRNISMAIGIVIFIMATLKITVHRKTFWDEYQNAIPASLYGAYSMLSMILGAYLFDFNNLLGKGLWSFGIIFHAVAILLFTYKNVIKNFKFDHFVPSWFVTYNGIMVSIVVGGAMNEPFISKIILFYGILIFFIILPFMLRRLIVKSLPDMVYHTKAVLIAPSSLCIVGYLNVIKNPNPTIAFILYGIVFITLLSIVWSIPKFFSFEFHPGFAGTTFPMAIGTVATFKMSSYLASINMNNFAEILRNIAGLQLYLTTAIVSFVFYCFLKKIKVSK